MSTIFANGTIASTTTLAAVSGNDQLGASTLSSIINNGTVLFAESGSLGSYEYFYGNLVNNGLIQSNVSTAAGGQAIAMGYGSTANSLTNSSTGRISFTDTNSTTGSALSLTYNTIANAGQFSASFTGGSTFTAAYANVNNTGSILLASTGLTGSAVTLGGSALSLVNSGNLSITHTGGSTGDNVNVAYGTIVNGGTFTTVVTGGSTVTWGNANVSNTGSILIASTTLGGASVSLGASGLTMNNVGRFTVDESGASTVSSFNSYYGTLLNSGSYNFTASSANSGAIAHWYNSVINTGTMVLSATTTATGVSSVTTGFDGTLNNTGTISISNLDVYVDALTATTGTVQSTGNFVLGAGGDLVLLAGSGSASGQTITFSTVANAGTLILGDTSFAGKIRGFTTGDHLDVMNVTPTGLSYNATTGILAVNSASTGYSLNIGLGYDASKFSTTLIGEDVKVVYQISYAAACFLPGTLIATPDGERPVEAIGAGDTVLTLVDDALQPATVRWTGSRTVRVRPGIDPIDAYPVRIRRDAFAPGLPHKDLLVTSEHCLFVDGRLVPARMLVNGGSITVETGIACYSFHHVELDRHGILLSDGLPSESYLDTGNRNQFAQSDRPALHPDFVIASDHKSWDDAAAPLATDINTVRPIWDRLAARSAMIGHALPDRPSLVCDADPHLLTENGERIDPVLMDGRFLAFVVPARAGQVRLASRAARPADVVGPFLDDRRTLGVKVGRIGAAAGHDRLLLDLVDAQAGWHGVEADGRWTDGLAVLPIGPVGDTALHLDIEIIATVGYPAAASQHLALAA